MIGDPHRKEIALKYYLEGFEDAYNHFYFNNIQKLLSSIEDGDDVSDEIYQKAQKLRRKTMTLFEKFWKIPDPQYLSLDEVNKSISNIGIRSEHRFQSCLDEFLDNN